MPETGFATVNLAAMLADTAKRTPERTAVIFGGDHITYGRLWQETKAYAGALRARGIGVGDRVAVLLPNVPDFPRAYFAILSLGAIVVPVHALLKAEEIAYVLRDSGASQFICAAPLLGEGAKAAQLAGVPLLSVMVPDEKTGELPFPRLEDEASVAEPIDGYRFMDPGATATILYTSGTTGKPKGAMGSHFSLVEHVNTLLNGAIDVTPDDVILGALPLFHTFGQMCVMNVGFRRGASVVFVPKFDGAAALALLNAHRCTIMTGVPTMYIALLEAAKTNPERPPLRYGLSGGAAIPVAVIGRMSEEFGISVHEGYGLTETSPVATFNHYGKPTRPGTIGQPIWGTEVIIADAALDDRIVELPRGELGEICVRGHNLFKGYLNRPEADAEAVVDGWFRTGDLGTMSDDDYVTIVDRKKDMIVRNGYNVYPREVEEVLARHEAVSSCAVYGVPDPVHQQEVYAAVTLMPGATATPEELIEFVKEKVAPYKFPRHIDIVDALPIGPSGKVLKRVLVARHVPEQAPAGA
ncbi:long-chain-fatty-acid--CoA ligase [Gryllotalpicola ginsengisoli]|uniref:long-chain-fatty-acid--CoA ligase n=1 Tax=Gryllotalpicola ginsengisoli TaxID=444608 RepID=UPI0003B5E885|nr:long-chain fatty acid--CoA ligase [Gryllotalpicola ginsengisoli]